MDVFWFFIGLEVIIGFYVITIIFSIRVLQRGIVDENVKKRIYNDKKNGIN